VPKELYSLGVYIGATWQIQLNNLGVVVMDVACSQTTLGNLVIIAIVILFAN